jgi:hypothetical protein
MEVDMTDQKIADVAVAQAAARAAAADAARRKAAGGAPAHTHRHGNDLLTAVIVGVVLFATVAFAVFANR